MVDPRGTARSTCRKLGWNLMAGVAIAALAAGCSKLGNKDKPQKKVAAINYSKQADRPPLVPNNPHHKKTAKWASKFEKNPADAKTALNYVRSLKAIGSKDRALEVAQRAYEFNPDNADLASEIGRLALEQDKIQMAEQFLSKALQKQARPDWKVLSALGTIQAKQGDHKKAQTYYLAALKEQPGATSVYNNLALSYALDGKAGSAEKLLKEAVDKGHNSEVLRQNLALVLGVQNKFSEAKQVAEMDLDESGIENNVSYLRKMVKQTKIAKAAKAKKIVTAKKSTKTKKTKTAATQTAEAKKVKTKTVRIAKTDQITTGSVRTKDTAAPTQLMPKKTVAAKAAPKPKAKPAKTVAKKTATPKKKPAATNVASAQSKKPTKWDVTVQDAVVQTAQVQFVADNRPKEDASFDPFNND